MGRRRHWLHAGSGDFAAQYPSADLTPRLLVVAAYAEEASKGGFGADLLYEGIVKWASKLNPDTLVVATTTILSLVAGRYTVTHSMKADTTTFMLGPKEKEGGVLAKVEADWESAVAQAKRWGAIDEGMKGSSRT
jgi:hypothetical protein